MSTTDGQVDSPVTRIERLPDGRYLLHGETFEAPVRASGVILASGGFEGSARLRERHLGYRVFTPSEARNTMPAIDDFAMLLRLTPDMLAEVTDSDSARSRVEDTIKDDGAAYKTFRRACRFGEPFAGSWIHGPGDQSAYLSLELAAAALDDHRYRTLLASIVLSTSTAIPHDYRGMAAEELARSGPARSPARCGS